MPVTDGSSHDTTPLWSPDGKLLYFGSDRDGFNCIWARAVDGAKKRPGRPAFAVAHFHAAARHLGNVGVAFRGMSLAHDKIVFPLEEFGGNIWLMR